MAMLPLSLPSYRPSGVLAIKQIAAHFKLPADTRDLAVQLFDRLLTSQTQESMVLYSEPHKEQYVKLAVITSVIIASKMLDVGALRAVSSRFEACICIISHLCFNVRTSFRLK